MSLSSRIRALRHFRPAAMVPAIVATLSLVAGGLVAAALLPGAAPGAPGTLLAASCGTTNLALNQPTTASSLENATFPAANATDGNTGTRWSSAFSDPQWLEVDLGSVQTICQVTLMWETAYGKAFQIQDVHRQLHLDLDLLDHHRHRRHPDPQRLRLRPLHPHARHHQGHRSSATALWEFQVFGTRAAARAARLTSR